MRRPFMNQSGPSGHYFAVVRSLDSIYIHSGASQVALVVKDPPPKAGDVRDSGLILGSGRAWQPIPVFLPGGSHG